MRLKYLVQVESVILEVVNYNVPINIPKFAEYCQQCAQLYVELYSWYHMPNALHRLLIHGPRIAQLADFPLGALGEEAQEASNKIWKHDRLFHSRKCSREATNIDVLHMALAASDPRINSLREPPPKRRKIVLTDEVRSLLLIAPDVE